MTTSSERTLPTPDPDCAGPFLEDRHRDLTRELARWVPGQIETLPDAESDTEGRELARTILERLGNAGWIRFALPEEHGGAPGGPDLRSCCLVREALAATSPLADAVYALQALGSTPLVIAGTDEQKTRWLPGAADGTVMTAFAMTETGAGSDVAALSARAEADPDGYRISGEKTLISNAGIADVYVVFVSTGERDDGRNQITALLVPADSDGLSLVETLELSEPHPLGTIRLDECRIPTASRLGDEGDGFAIGMRTLDRLRPTVGAAACGMGGRALAEAVDHARNRSQFGRRLADFQLVQDKIARMATELDAARLLVYRAARAHDRGDPGTARLSSMAKAFATEAAQRIVDEAIQIVGGQACLASHPLDRLYRSVRALRIYEGATEIQRLIVARDILGSG